MNKNIKIGATILLAGTCIVTSGLYVGAKFLGNKAEEQKYTNISNMDGDIAFKVNSSEEDDILSKEIIDVEEKKESQNKVNEENKNEIKVVDTNITSEIKSQSNTVTNNIQDVNIYAIYGESAAKERIKNIDFETKEKLTRMVKTNDSEYIKKEEEEYSCVYNFEVSDYFKAGTEFSKEYSTLWGIEEESYYSVCAYNSASASEARTPMAYYIVGANSGKIYNVPNEGYRDAYEIKDNQIVKAYKFCPRESNEFIESYKWR